jgi:hypothetical protein
MKINQFDRDPQFNDMAIDQVLPEPELDYSHIGTRVFHAPPIGIFCVIGVLSVFALLYRLLACQ